MGKKEKDQHSAPESAGRLCVFAGAACALAHGPRGFCHQGEVCRDKSVGGGARGRGADTTGEVETAEEPAEGNMMT